MGDYSEGIGTMSYKDRLGKPCPHCKKRELYYQDELEMNMCDNCADKQAESYREMKEFEHYHT